MQAVGHGENRGVTICTFLIAGELDRKRLRTALAAVVPVPVDAIDVADDDVVDRNWDAPVLCTCESASGDVTWVLDLHLAEGIGPPTAEQLASALAVPVLHESMSYPPSAYLLAAPDGPPTRARVYEGEDADGSSVVIDAVERPVALLPHVRVEAQPEVIHEYRMATPVRDAFDARLAAGSEPAARADRVRDATNRLGGWENFTMRMLSGWPPDGWFPVHYYREALENRDRLAVVAEDLPPTVAPLLVEALAGIDDAFRGGSREVGVEAVARALGPTAASGAPGWWWERLPDPLPWRDQPRAEPAREPRTGS